MLVLKKVLIIFYKTAKSLIILLEKKERIGRRKRGRKSIFWEKISIFEGEGQWNREVFQDDAN